MTVIVKELIITSQVYDDSNKQEIDIEQLKRDVLKSCERMVDKKLKRR